MTLFCFYDLEVSPTNFDFLTFAVCAKAEAARIDEEAHIVFVPGQNNGFGPIKKAYGIEEHKFRLPHILFSICYSLDLGYTYYKDRKSAEQFYFCNFVAATKPIIEHKCFPYNYNINQPKKDETRNCSLIHILEQYEKGPLFFPKPTEFATCEVWKRFPEPPVVITLRETYSKGRNSNNEEWMKFADYVWPTNDVVFVRDTSVFDEPLSDDMDQEFQTYPIASVDLDFRLALYHHAKCNFSVGGGAATLLYYSDSIPYRCFKIWSDEHGSSSRNFLAQMGFPFGSQWPWCGKNQEIVWKDDTFENLKESYDKWVSGEN